MRSFRNHCFVCACHINPAARGLHIYICLHPTSYIPNGYDYSASKRSMWLKLLYLAATNRKISSEIRLKIKEQQSKLWKPPEAEAELFSSTEA